MNAFQSMQYAAKHLMKDDPAVLRIVKKNRLDTKFYSELHRKKMTFFFQATKTMQRANAALKTCKIKIKVWKGIS